MRLGRRQKTEHGERTTDPDTDTDTVTVTEAAAGEFDAFIGRVAACAAQRLIAVSWQFRRSQQPAASG